MEEMLSRYWGAGQGADNCLQYKHSLLQNKAQDLCLDSSFETAGRPLWTQWWNFGLYKVLLKRQTQTAAVTRWYKFYVVRHPESSVYLACVRLCVVRCGMGRVISCHFISKINYYWTDSINTYYFTYRSSYSAILLNVFRCNQMHVSFERTYHVCCHFVTDKEPVWNVFTHSFVVSFEGIKRLERWHINLMWYFLEDFAVV